MKTLIFTLTIAILALGTFAVQPAYAHCGTCEASEKSHKMKPCEKSMNAEKPCTKCMEAKVKKVTCKVCEQNDKRFEMNKEMTKGMYKKTEKGDYHVQSRGPRTSNYND